VNEDENKTENEDAAPANNAPATGEDTPVAGEDAPQAEPSEHLLGQAIDVIKTVFDPEIPVNIYDLGLIYNVDARVDGSVHVRMTLTSPMCPVAESLPGDVKQKIQEIDGVETVQVELVWEPPWDKDMMSDDARMVLMV
jgi:FeS assembly SUF system protein